MFLMKLPKLKTKKKTQEWQVGVLLGEVWKNLYWDLPTFFFFLREKWEWGEEPEKSNQVTKDIENEFFKKKLMGMQLFHL